MGAYNDEVLFIHIPKTGGWSVKNYMKEHLRDVLLPDDPLSNLPIGHVRLQDIERFTGRAPDSFHLILAVLRNPYEQQISQACFWAMRYIEGGRHVHDVATWRHVDEARVFAKYHRCARSSEMFAFEPDDINLTGFVSDPRCDFHVWYEQHHGYRPGQSAAEQQQTRPTDIPAADGQNRYEDFGGYYRYWLTVDGEIPKQVCLVKLETINTVRVWLKPFAKGELPDVPVSNVSPHNGSYEAWLLRWPYSSSLIKRKFAWTFGQQHYRA